MWWSGLAKYAYLQTALSFVVTYVVQDDIFAQLHVLGQITVAAIEAHEKPRGQAPAVVAQNDFVIERHPSAQQYSACVPRRLARCMAAHAPFSSAGLGSASARMIRYQRFCQGSHLHVL